MKSFLAFFRKELLASVRGGKILIFGILFFAFGLMNPGIAKITPWLLGFLSESLEGTGMNITTVTVSALDSWAQFFKNTQMALIVFILLYGNIFTGEYGSGTLVLLLTKGLARYKVIWAKALTMLAVWTGGYFMSFGVTYVLNELLWDNAVAESLGISILYYWFFGVLMIALTVLFSVIFSNYGFVLLGVGGFVMLMTLIGIAPKISRFLPTALMNGTYIVYGMNKASDFAVAAVIAAVITVASFVASIFLMKKKQI